MTETEVNTTEPDVCETCGVIAIPIDGDVCPNCGEFMEFLNPSNPKCDAL